MTPAEKKAVLAIRSREELVEALESIAALRSDLPPCECAVVRRPPCWSCSDEQASLLRDAIETAEIALNPHLPSLPPKENRSMRIAMIEMDE